VCTAEPCTPYGLAPARKAGILKLQADAEARFGKTHCGKSDMGDLKRVYAKHWGAMLLMALPLLMPLLIYLMNPPYYRCFLRDAFGNPAVAPLYREHCREQFYCFLIGGIQVVIALIFVPILLEKRDNSRSRGFKLLTVVILVYVTLLVFFTLFVGMMGPAPIGPLRRSMSPAEEEAARKRVHPSSPPAVQETESRRTDQRPM